MKTSLLLIALAAGTLVAAAAGPAAKPNIIFILSDNGSSYPPTSASFKPDGLSLVSFLKDGAAPQREYFYWELHEGASLQTLRWGDWKAVRNGPSKPIEIYNLKTDAAESRNLAADMPELVAKAEAMMTLARVDDPNFPMRDSKPAAAKKKNAKPKN